MVDDLVFDIMRFLAACGDNETDRSDIVSGGPWLTEIVGAGVSGAEDTTRGVADGANIGLHRAQGVVIELLRVSQP